MKKFLVVLVVLAAAAMFAGCKSYDVTSNRVGYSIVGDIAVKDYEVVKIISLESQEVSIFSPLGLKKTIRGSRIVWSDLMAEAAKAGADDVINVRIEMTDQNERIPRFFEFFTGYTSTWKFQATALAIKYTNAIERVKSGSGVVAYDLDDQNKK